MNRKVWLFILGISSLPLAYGIAATPRPRADILEEEDHATRPSSMPLVLNYKGPEADAQWRKEAEARIEKFEPAPVQQVIGQL